MVTSAVFRMACFDHHRAEITDMQFIGHPLAVHQFVTVPWDFKPVPYCQPSSPTPMECATSTVFGMAFLAGSKVNIQHLHLLFFLISSYLRKAILDHFYSFLNLLPFLFSTNSGCCNSNCNYIYIYI